MLSEADSVLHREAHVLILRDNDGKCYVGGWPTWHMHIEDLNITVWPRQSTVAAGSSRGRVPGSRAAGWGWEGQHFNRATTAQQLPGFAPRCCSIKMDPI